MIATLNCVHIESSCSPFEFDLSLRNFPRAIDQYVKPSPTLALESPSSMITLLVGGIFWSVLPSLCLIRICHSWCICTDTGCIAGFPYLFSGSDETF